MSSVTLLLVKRSASLLWLALAACSGDGERPDGPPTDGSEPDHSAARAVADVTAAGVSGEPGAYTFSVTVESPDTGCDQYADWWEVMRADGTLVYRRILAHSHVDEQPFTRSGGPVAVAPDDEVIVRAHLSTGGYGGRALRGSVGTAFAAADLDSALGRALETAAPQPDGCAF